MNFVPFSDLSQIATSGIENTQVTYVECLTYLISVTKKPPLSVSNPVRVAIRSKPKIASEAALIQGLEAI